MVKKQRPKKLKAFTLTELMVVLIIIGILVLLALPNLMPLISKAKGMEAQLQLKHAYNLQKNYFYVHSRYSDDLAQIDFEQEKLVTDEGNANYLIEIEETNGTEFIIRATAVVDFDGDGDYNTWEIDQDQNLKEIQKD